MQDELQGIAVIGMACRFPGARNPEEFWRNLRDGVESIVPLTGEQLRAAGVSPGLADHPAYVKAASMIDGIDELDAAFFGLSPREAELTDPQQRLFLEHAWEALENAGYDAAAYAGRIGVFAGSRLNTYLLKNVYPQRATIRNVDPLQVLIGNEKDYLATQVSYRLGLTGPSLGVQTACSTALVAVSLACQSLFGYQCDMALAGAVSVRVPQAEGYVFQEGGIASPDGHCRAFDARAQGTVFGNGLGIVVLKRLEDAVRDGDAIRAVIRGWAINNDGSSKVGYTAPGQTGQADVIAMAQALADVSPETIGYVEAHGTGTPLGDPVEIAALEEVFRSATGRRGFCALGSVKTNIGHLDTAAGVAGLIKTALALEHRQIPPTLHFERPNPQIRFEEGPFYVNARLSDWRANGVPRRAGVSSFGIGGTNAHLVLEEAPPTAPGDRSRSAQLLVLSARSAAALDTASANLARHLHLHPEVDLADVAYTLQTGRRGFPHRRTVVVRDRPDAVQALTELDPRRVFTEIQAHRDRPVAFLFPGQGAQYPNMGLELYREEPVFREELDRCCALLCRWLPADLRPLLYPAAGEESAAAERLAQTDVTQPALFAVEHALAKLWMAWGIRPRAMAGHSVGEYVAACLAGVLSLEDASRLVAARARLMQEMPPGAMLSVPLPEDALRPRLGEGLALAALNGPGLCTVAGTPEAVEALERLLAGEGVACRRLHTGRAFHSAMMEPILERFAGEVGRVRLSPPQIPFLSNLSGGWITAAEATSPEYWVRHLRRTVRFAANLETLLASPDIALLEVGPGTTLGSLAIRHPARTRDHWVGSSMRHPSEPRADMTVLLEALGGLWLAGARVDWSGFYARERRRRVPLPAYPFERQRYWIEALPASPAQTPSAPAGRFAVPVWKQTVAPLPWRPNEESGPGKRCLLFMDEAGLATGIARRLTAAGREVIRVAAGSSFVRLDADEYALEPADPAGYGALLADLKAQNRVPDVILHCWSVTGDRGRQDMGATERLQERGFFSLLFLAQGLGEHGIGTPLRLAVISDGLYSLGGETRPQPAKATILGPCRVIPQEYPNVLCSSLDVVLPEPGPRLEKLVDQVLGELAGPPEIVAWRGNLRWAQTLEPVSLQGPPGLPRRLRPEGVYLITGGLGGVGLALAEHLARTARAKLVLTGRSSFPAREEWDAWEKAHAPNDETRQKIQRLRQLERAGGEVLTLRADVASLPQMRDAVEQAQERFGEIHGVIHAAGLPGGGLIQFKTREAAAEVLAPKLAGTLVLEALFSNAPLDFLLLCSSTFALQGGVGRVDYCAANAFLDVYARHRDGSGAVSTIAVNWDGWSEVGMAARALAPRSGARREVSPEEGPSTSVDHPLLGRRLLDASAATVFVTDLDPAADWVLAEHRLMTTPAPPGAALVEMMRAAAAETLGGGKVQLRDVTFLTPLWVPEGESRAARTVLKPGKTSWSASVVTRAGAGEAGSAWKEHATASLVRTSRPARRISLEKVAARCSGVVKTFEPGQAWRAGGLVFWGPRWSCLRRLEIGADEGLATLELPPAYSGDLERFGLHPALLDVATACGLALAKGGFFLPLFYGCLTCHGPLPGRLYSHFRLRGGNPGEDVLQLDISLLDPEGVELVTIEEFTLKRVEEAALDRARAQAAAAAPPVPAPAHFQGLSTAEAVEAFSSILDRCTSPQIVVRAWTEAVPEASPSLAEIPIPAAASHARPALKTRYEAPRNEIERALAEIWQQALGFGQIGIYDNFFQLGGHSVVAIQLISRIREELEIELPLNVLFEANTIADLAAVVVRILSGQEGAESLSEGLAGLDGSAGEGVYALETGSRGTPTSSSAQTLIADLPLKELKRVAQQRKKGPREAALPILRPAPERRSEPFPLTDVQEAYWIGRQNLFELGNVASHAYIEIPFRRLDLARLNRALDRLIERHEMLRAIILRDGRQQILTDVPPYRVQEMDLRGRSAAAVETHLGALRSEMSHQVLPADRWPLFELRASVLDGERSIVHLSFDILIGDIWSFELLQRELGRLYTDPEADLPPIGVSFRDYVMAQVAFEETPAFQRSVDYWQQRLPTLPPAPELPLAVNPGALREPRFKRRRATLDAASWGLLKTRATELGITPSGLLLAAYGEVLSRWSKSPRFTINVTTFNRMPIHPDINRVVGDFTSLTLVALDTSRGGPFAERAQGVQQQLWRDLEHGHVSAVRLLRERKRTLPGAADAAMPVVFTSLLFNAAREEASAPEPAAPQPQPAEASTSHNISQTPQVWLDFQVGEERGTLVFNWDAVEDLFPAGLLDDMFGAFRAFLRSLGDDAAAWSRTSSLEISVEQLRQRLEANATAAPLPTLRLHELFEEQVRRDSGRLAVAAAGLRMTYGELDRLANRLAGRLRRAGARPNRLVAVAMEKGWEQVAAVLAILKSGAAYLPIDPDLPAERLRHLLEHGQVALALTQPWLDERLAWPPGVERFRVDTGGGEPMELADDAAPPAPLQALDDLAYVIFTSGSTGLPKGVAIDHRGAVNTILDINRRFQVGPGDRVLALSSLSFDLSVYDLFGLLAAGGCVVVPESTAQRSPDRWYELLRDERVTLWNSVPALMQMLAEYAADRGAACLPSLRVALLSGDWIPVALPDQVRALAPEARVISLGGATEASIWSVLYPIGRVDPAWKSIPYGRPMDNQTMEVLDAALEPRPVWVPGDLYIGGIGLAQGYWRDEEKTRASFIVHPGTGERLYRTGDLARWLPGGQLEFLGREDSQVKVQGYRIELGEIETALEQHPAVRHGIALAVGTGNSRRLVACVVPDRPVVTVEETPARAAARVAPPVIAEGGRIAAGTVPFAAFGELLGSLLQRRTADTVLSKYRYPSAGSLYPVQTYLVVRPDRVDGVSGGTYYFHPRENRLIQLSGAALDAETDLPAVLCDRESFAHAAFAIVLVGNLAAIEPVYGELGRPFCLLEAGAMSALLREMAPGCGLALEPALPSDAGPIRQRLGLGEEHVPVHVLLGGRLAWEDADGRSAPLLAGIPPAPPVLRLDAAPVLRKSLSDPLAELEFRLSEPGLRKTDPSRLTVQLPAPREGGERARLYNERRSHREFLSRPLAAGLLTELLEGVALPRLRLYVHLKAERVAGLAGGFYRYELASEEPWVPLSGAGEIDASVHATVNQRPFEQSAFSLFLIAGRTDAPDDLAPWALDSAALEAGSAIQRLMERAPGCGIGLCPIGTVEVDRLRGRFGWGAGDILVHSLIGGAISAGGTGRAASRPEEDGLGEELRELLGQKLPPYMVPAAIFTVDQVPLTANGKVDRKALASRIDTPAQEPAVYAPPRSPVERRVAAFWQEVLGVGKVGMNDNFFELGGSSVSMVRLHRKLQDLLGREIPLTQLFAHPTPRALAALLDRQSPESASLGENLERAEMRRAARDRRRRPGQLSGRNEMESDE